MSGQCDDIKLNILSTKALKMESWGFCFTNKWKNTRHPKDCRQFTELLLEKETEKAKLLNTVIIRQEEICHWYFYSVCYTSTLKKYIVLAMLGLCCCTWGLLFIAVPWLLLFRGTGASVAVVHGLSCPVACGIFLNQGSNSCALPSHEDSYPLCQEAGPISTSFN